MLNGLPRNWLGEAGIQASAKLSALLARRNILLYNVVGNMRQFIGTTVFDSALFPLVEEFRIGFRPGSVAPVASVVTDRR